MSDESKLTGLIQRIQVDDQTMDNPMYIAYVNELKCIKKNQPSDMSFLAREQLKKYNANTQNYNEKKYLTKFNQLNENNKLRCLNAFLNVGSYDSFALPTLEKLLEKIQPNLITTFYNNNKKNNFWETTGKKIIKDRLKQPPKSDFSDEDLEKEISDLKLAIKKDNPSVKELPNEDDEEKAEEPGPGPDEAGEEKAEEPDEPIEKIINELISEQLPKYKSGKNNEYYRQQYYNKNQKDMEKATSVGGGKTQKKKKRNRPTIIRQWTIKNKVRY
jgi:hypothetical protein